MYYDVRSSVHQIPRPVSPSRCVSRRQNDRSQTRSSCSRIRIASQVKKGAPTATHTACPPTPKVQIQQHTEQTDKQLLFDLLTRNPEPLELTNQELEDYERDTTWPFNDIKKGSLLGRGGFAIVWLATDTTQGARIAVKQIARRAQSYLGEIEAAKSEIMVAERLSRFDFHHPGHRFIASLLRAVETRRGMWIVQEFGGIPLSKMIFETSGVSHNGCRIYDVKHLPFRQLLQRDETYLKIILRQLFRALDLLALNNVVHSDLKPDNILIGLGDDEELRVRLCDFGSAFIFDEDKEQRPFSTPEYMPPEALKQTSFSSFSSRGGLSSLHRQNTDHDTSNRKGYPWSFDIWSLGCIWLEIMHGVPLWIPFDCRLPSRRIVKGGLFGVKRREPARIVANQEAVLKDLNVIWHRAHKSATDAQGENSPSNKKNQAYGLTLIKCMLSVNPNQRIAPSQALQHLFLQ